MQDLWYGLLELLGIREEHRDGTVVYDVAALLGSIAFGLFFIWLAFKAVFKRFVSARKPAE